MSYLPIQNGFKCSGATRRLKNLTYEPSFLLQFIIHLELNILINSWHIYLWDWSPYCATTSFGYYQSTNQSSMPQAMSDEPNHTTILHVKPVSIPWMTWCCCNMQPYSLNMAQIVLCHVYLTIHTVQCTREKFKKPSEHYSWWRPIKFMVDGIYFNVAFNIDESCKPPTDFQPLYNNNQSSLTINVWKPNNYNNKY